MNWKQKILTILALSAFLAIGYLHMAQVGSRYPSYPPLSPSQANEVYRGERTLHEIAPGYPGYVPHPFTPWTMVAVTYAALFFLLASRRTTPSP